MTSNSWLRALKVWNMDRPKYSVPRRGTPEYEQVKAIQAKVSGKTKGGFLPLLAAPLAGAFGLSKLF